MNRIEPFPQPRSPTFSPHDDVHYCPRVSPPVGYDRRGTQSIKGIGRAYRALSRLVEMPLAETASQIRILSSRPVGRGIPTGSVAFRCFTVTFAWHFLPPFNSADLPASYLERSSFPTDGFGSSSVTHSDPCLVIETRICTRPGSKRFPASVDSYHPVSPDI